VLDNEIETKLVEVSVSIISNLENIYMQFVSFIEIEYI